MTLGPKCHGFLSTNTPQDDVFDGGSPFPRPGSGSHTPASAVAGRERGAGSDRAGLAQAFHVLGAVAEPFQDLPRVLAE